MAYSDKVIEHMENPRNIGSLDRDDPNVGTGMVGAPACGDVMKLQLKINDSGIIEDAKFKTFGCGSAIASSSLVTTMVKGQSVEEAMKISNADIASELSLPPVKIGIMGCIVNGPGEMADADYGYVGSGEGVISLYKGKEVVRRNIPTSNAVDELIDLIKEHDDWVEVGAE